MSVRRPGGTLCRSRRSAALGFGGAIVAVLAACQTTVTQGSNVRPMPPKPTAGPVTPPTAAVNSVALLLLSPKARDTDGNGIPDTIDVEVYLFAEPFPAPVFADGEFIFRLSTAGTSTDRSAPALREWRFSGEVILAARSRALAGPCYRFALSLLADGGRELAVSTADLTLTFQASGDRPPVHISGVRTVQLVG